MPSVYNNILIPLVLLAAYTLLLLLPIWLPAHRYMNCSNFDFPTITNSTEYPKLFLPQHAQISPNITGTRLLHYSCYFYLLLIL